MVERLVRETGKAIYRSNPTIPKKSTFLQDGKLTPDEFVQAGDFLRSKCPLWNWQKGDAKLALKYLPPDKQYLEFKGVACPYRASKVTEVKDCTGTGDGEGEDEWVATEEDKPKAEAKPAGAASSSAPDEDEDENYMSFDDEDESAKQGGGNDEARKYDAHITYDIYYNSPRLYLIGYDSKGKKLSKDEIAEDLSKDHAGKTITFDPHPHLGFPVVSLHPCKHSVTMKAMIDHENEEGRQLKPEQYFIYFLKFVQTAIPSIQISNAIDSEN